MAQPTEAGLSYLMRLVAEERRAANGKKLQRIAIQRGNECGKLLRDGHMTISAEGDYVLTDAGREIVRLARLAGK
jgi:hypothetical protein